MAEPQNPLKDYHLVLPKPDGTNHGTKYLRSLASSSRCSTLMTSPVDCHRTNGDQAYDVGINRMTLKAADGKQQRDVGKYLIVWQKTNGTWKSVAASSTSNGPVK